MIVIKFLKKCKIHHITALIFLVLIVSIGSGTGLSMIVNTGTEIQQGNSDYIYLRDQVDKLYVDMLEFEGAYFKNKGSYINLNGLMARMMGQRWMNERVKLDNGHLSYLVNPIEDITTISGRIAKLYRRQQEQGKHFLFVMAPYQISKYDPQLPIGFEESGNEYADALVEKLKQNSIPVLDLREKMLEHNMVYAESFLKTDHHWKPEVGFWAYTEIIDTLVEQKVIEPIDAMYTNLTNYHVDTYQQSSLGSAGKRTGIYYAGVDDFSIIYPKFETSFRYRVPSANLDTKGSFEKVVIDYRYIKKADYFNNEVYNAYGSGNYGSIHYQNDNAPVSKKALLISDSFGNTSLKFLPLCISTCDEIDMRYYQDSFVQYYNEYDPDIIIILINPDSIDTLNATYDYFP